MHAVIKTGGKQYRVAPGDTVKVETLAAEVGQQVLLRCRDPAPQHAVVREPHLMRGHEHARLVDGLQQELDRPLVVVTLLGRAQPEAGAHRALVARAVPPAVELFAQHVMPRF